MAIDFVGIALAFLIILSLIIIVIAKVQGDKFIDVVTQIFDFVKEKTANE